MTDLSALNTEILFQTKLSSSYKHKAKVKVNPLSELTVDAINEKLRETKQV